METLYTEILVLVTVFTITWAEITVMPDVEGFEGETVTLPCTITQHGTLRWIWDGGVIATKPLNTTAIIGENGPFTGVVSITGEFNLRISPLKAGRDDRQFICVGSGGESQVTRVRLLVRVTRVSIQEANNGTTTVTAGKPKILTCLVTGYPSPDPAFSWTVDDEMETGQGSTFNLTADKSTKTIKCTATNRYSNGSVLSTAETTVTLNVLFLDFLGTTSPITIVEKENVSLLCSVEGNPPPVFEWHKSGTTKVSSTPNYILENAKRSAAGEYTCTANNSVGSGQTTVTLVVQYPPDVIVKVNDRSRTLSCEAHGVPDTYTFNSWEHLFGGKTIRTMEGNTTGPGNQSSIQLGNWSVEDTGLYVCGVSNGIGDMQRRYIYAKPETPAIFMEGQGNKEVVVYGTHEKLSVKFYVNPTVFKLEWKRTDRGDVLRSHTEHVTNVNLDLYGTSVKTLGTVTILLLNSSQLQDGQFTVAVRNLVNGQLKTSRFNMTLKVSKTSEDGEMSEANPASVIGGVVGSAVARFLILVVLFVLWKKRKGSPPSSQQDSDTGGEITDTGSVTGADNVRNVDINRIDYDTLGVPNVPDIHPRGDNCDQRLVSQKDLRCLNRQCENTAVLTEDGPEQTSYV